MFRLDTFARPFILALLVGVAACSGASTPAGTAGTPSDIVSPSAAVAGTTAPHKIIVVATTTQVTALTRVVAGDKVELTDIIKANMDAHEYEPTPEDVRSVANAKLVAINGVGLEKWLDKVISNSGTKAPIVDTSKGITIRKGDEEEPQGDPHIWFAIPNDIIMLDNIRDGLVQADPANADLYRANAAAYTNKLNDLDQYIMQQIATIPQANRKFVTNHDAFGYFVDRYGLDFVGSIIPSMDTNYQPSAQDFAKLVEEIKTQHVKAIFTEASINPNLAKQIGQEAGVNVVDGALYGDSLGPPGSGADTVDGMLKVDVDLLVSNLK